VKGLRKSEAGCTQLDGLTIWLNVLFLSKHPKPQVLVYRLLQRLAGSTEALPEQRLNVVIDG
jgi:hypothetical protein